MRILLINPNTFRTPPCIPVGLEYAAAALEKHGHDVHVFDAFHHGNPLSELTEMLDREARFDLAGVTVRNIDTAQAARFAFLLPDIRNLVEDLHLRAIPVLLGGIGFSAMPELVLDYTGADYGIAGPAELVLPGFCASGKLPGEEQPRVIDARRIGIDPDLVPARGKHINYKPYFHYGGIAGFATQYGCPGQCIYCMEAGTPMHFRNPDAVVEELRAMCAAGVDEFHLCDSEFNHSLDHCMEFLGKLEKAALPMKWALYLKPAPFTDDFAEGLLQTGANIVTLSVDSFEACRNGAYSWDDVAFAVTALRERGIRTAIDLSLGMPDEPDENAVETIRFFRENPADSVNVNAWYRVYAGTALEALLRKREDLHRFLSAPMPEGPPLEKLFFNCLPMARIKELIGNDPMFKLEGYDPGVNYELLRD